jgi:2-ketocyclohexanecarboxyl-CoA hydrolase
MNRELHDVTYEATDGVAWITVNRPDRYNAFRALTIDELIHCFKLAWGDRGVGVVVLTGAGDKAFCVGGDQKQRSETGDYGPSDYGVFQDEYLQRVIRDIPKPVIAAVNGYAIGGGQVLHVVCDITIAADHAQFGQAGPRVGSFDAGFGTAYLARIIGHKRAREVWMLCRRYSAETMREWGLVNAVVPMAELHDEVMRWAKEMLDLSPTALRFVKHSFNADTESIAGISALSFDGLGLFVATDEARTGVEAFQAKASPDFSPFR